MSFGKHQRLFFVFYEHVETTKKKARTVHTLFHFVYKMAGQAKSCMLTIFLLYFGYNFEGVLKFLGEERFIL